MENELIKDDGDFVINVYSPGNMLAKTINFAAPVYINGKGITQGTEPINFTDEQIARAIEAICGEDKPLDTMGKWAAVYWYLRWQCNYPVKPQEFCERISMLPFSKEISPECKYESIRKFTKLGFMEQDARVLDKVRPSQSETALFFQFKTVVLALAEELGKISLL